VCFVWLNSVFTIRRWLRKFLQEIKYKWWCFFLLNFVIWNRLFIDHECYINRSQRVQKIIQTLMILNIKNIQSYCLHIFSQFNNQWFNCWCLKTRNKFLYLRIISSSLIRLIDVNRFLSASNFWIIVVLFLRYNKFVRSIEIRINKSKIFKASILSLYVRRSFLWFFLKMIKSCRFAIDKSTEDVTLFTKSINVNDDNLINFDDSMMIKFTNVSILSRLIIISIIKNHSSQSSRLFKIIANFWSETTLNKDIFEVVSIRTIEE
jgi:hypothetical protein